ncbi:MAG TPA: MEDS domain-containing protein [Candidatus Thermoplasmatota archaeon]|nr:MEDS domain-containing protein [Candidatus Thermoplasmatota archaeon]
MGGAEVLAHAATAERGPPRPHALELGLRDGDHACILYGSEEEHEAVVGAFLAEGLRGRQRVLNLLHAHTPQQMRDLLARQGVDAAACEATGQLTLAAALEAYAPDGHFDPQSMVDLLLAAVARARQDGWEGMRGSGEMCWVTEGIPGSGRAMEYEALLNKVVPGTPLRAICQYDTRLVPAQTLLEVLTTHPIVFIGTRRLENFYYMPPDEYLSPERAGNQLRRWVRNLEDRQSLEELERVRRVQAEVARRAREELAEKARFVNAAAHELNTPLTPMAIQLSLLRQADDAQKVQEIRANLAVLERSHARLQATVSRLLHAVEGSHHMPVVQPDVRLDRVAQAVCGEMQPTADAQGTRLGLTPAPASAMADPALVKAVLRDLVENALRRAPGGRVTVSIRQDGSGHAVEVEDTGPRVADDFHQQAFDPFTGIERSDPALTLHVAREMVERMGGRLTAGPGRQGGAAFRLWVPDARTRAGA